MDQQERERVAHVQREKQIVLLDEEMLAIKRLGGYIGNAIVSVGPKVKSIPWLYKSEWQAIYAACKEAYEVHHSRR
jgi:hypothetical protein